MVQRLNVFVGVRWARLREKRGREWVAEELGFFDLGLGWLGLFGLEQGSQGFLVNLGFREQPGHRGNLGRKTHY